MRKPPTRQFPAGQREAFARLVRVAAQRLENGDLDSAAAVVQLAAEYAWRRHPGEFASPELEAIGSRIGTELPKNPSSDNDSSIEEVRTVLHVVSEAYGIGGHTQIASLWMQKDRAHTHLLALTRQSGMPLPRVMSDIVADSGGTVTYLDQMGGDLLSRARALARLATCADVVVLHVHPWDILPVISFATDQTRPPVVFVNHADHVFWLGVTIADVVVHSREVAVELARRRRGIPSDRSLVFPFPLPKPTRTPRARAKRSLGLDPEHTLLVTAASEYKYATSDEPSFVELVTPVLNRYPQARLLALGPRDAGAWADAREATDGRLHALGARDDVGPYYAAADVYLDSTSLTSVTSLLEAAQHGLPLLRYSAGRGGDLPLFEPNIAALKSSVVTAHSVSEYRRVASELIDDPARRTALGERARREVLRDHGDAAFRTSLQQIYAKAAAIERRSSIWPPTHEPTGYLDRQLEALHANSEITAMFLPATRKHAAVVHHRSRPRIWRAVAGVLAIDRAVGLAWLRHTLTTALERARSRVRRRR
jgi:hypothetical protein